jgi:hypothetical protein
MRKLMYLFTMYISGTSIKLIQRRTLRSCDIDDSHNSQKVSQIDFVVKVKNKRKKPAIKLHFIEITFQS